MSKWVFIVGKDYTTFPKEGYTVLVSDGTNYDTAYYIMSGEYKWWKYNVNKEDGHEFDSFEITCWKIINENEYYDCDKNRNR